MDGLRRFVGSVLKRVWGSNRCAMVPYFSHDDERASRRCEITRLSCYQDWFSMVDRREANRGAASKSDFETIFRPTRTRNPDGCVGGWDVGTLSLCHCRGNEQLTVDFWLQEPNDHHLASCVFAIQASRHHLQELDVRHLDRSKR